MTIGTHIITTDPTPVRTKIANILKTTEGYTIYIMADGQWLTRDEFKEAS